MKIINLSLILVKDYRLVMEILQQAKLDRIIRSYHGFGFYDPEFGYYVVRDITVNEKAVNTLAVKYPQAIILAE